MMYIEGHWETVDTLQDVVRVVREYYNHELADKIEELIPEDNTENLAELDELRSIVEEIRELVM